MSKDKKTRFEISADELEYRTLKHQEQNIEPGQKAVMVLEAALDTVLKKLGVNVEDIDTIPEQMDALGIMINEHTDERAPQLNGFFVSLIIPGDIIPYAWVGAARLGGDGKCWCDIQWFREERLSETGGVKVV